MYHRIYASLFEEKSLGEVLRSQSAKYSHVVYVKYAGNGHNCGQDDQRKRGHTTTALSVRDRRQVRRLHLSSVSIILEGVFEIPGLHENQE